MTDGAAAAPETQALLRVLAAGRDVAELGAAFGQTAAIMAETARSVVTVELDPERVRVAREHLAGLPNVELLAGDAYELLQGRGPFGLVFADGGIRQHGPGAWETVVSITALGGLIVKDDMTPGRAVEGDEIREFLFGDPRLAATEILVSPQTAVIVAARIG